MGFVLADQQGWLPSSGGQQQPAAPFSDTVVLHTFQKLRAAVNSGEADFFMWEHFTSKRYYDAGEIRRVGEIYTPWSSWKIVAATSLTRDGLDGRVADMLGRLDSGVAHFKANQDEAVRYISTELDYSEEDAREWLKTVRFADRTEGVDGEVVDGCVRVLRKAGVLMEGKGMEPAAMVVSRH